MSSKKISHAQSAPLATRIKNASLKIQGKNIKQLEHLLITFDNYDGFRAKKPHVVRLRSYSHSEVLFNPTIDAVLIALSALPGGLDALATAISWTTCLVDSLTTGSSFSSDDDSDSDSDDNRTFIKIDGGFIEGARAKPYAKALYDALSLAYDHQMSSPKTFKGDAVEELYERGAFNAVNAIAASYCATSERSKAGE